MQEIRWLLGLPPWAPLGELTALPQTPWVIMPPSRIKKQGRTGSVFSICHLHPKGAHLSPKLFPSIILFTWWFATFIILFFILHVYFFYFRARLYFFKLCNSCNVLHTLKPTILLLLTDIIKLVRKINDNFVITFTISWISEQKEISRSRFYSDEVEHIELKRLS